LIPDAAGQKLSKSGKATGLRELRDGGATPADIRRLVGLPCFSGVNAITPP
jgi:glutamyl-Q tRNA(Asp) synthetase